MRPATYCRYADDNRTIIVTDEGHLRRLKRTLEASFVLSFTMKTLSYRTSYEFRRVNMPSVCWDTNTSHVTPDVGGHYLRRGDRSSCSWDILSHSVRVKQVLTFTRNSDVDDHSIDLQIHVRMSIT